MASPSMIADWQVRVESDYTGIAVAPIMSIPAKHARFPALNHHLSPVAIVLDFVNPVLPLRRLINRGSKPWLEKPESGGSKGMALNRFARSGSHRGIPDFFPNPRPA